MKKKAIVYSTGARSLYVGKLERQFKRSSAQASLLVSLEDDLELVVPGKAERVRNKSFLIPAGMDVQVDTHGAHVTLFFLDNLNTDFLRLLPMMRASVQVSDQRCFYGLAGTPDVIEFGNFLRNARPALSEVERIAYEWLNHPLRCQANTDPRIAHAVELIRQNYGENDSVAWIAQQVGLSAPRLTELFKQVMGVPIRRFRLWHRIFATAANLEKGASLTDAALKAGFADYAQFSRTYRMLAGGNPSDARDNTEIHAMGYCLD
ncbi:MAG: helix-turn-helix domain-containing protein [Acidobacteriota bacterium]